MLGTATFEQLLAAYVNLRRQSPSLEESGRTIHCRSAHSCPPTHALFFGNRPNCLVLFIRKVLNTTCHHRQCTAVSARPRDLADERLNHLTENKPVNGSRHDSSNRRTRCTATAASLAMVNAVSRSNSPKRSVSLVIDKFNTPTAWPWTIGARKAAPPFDPCLSTCTVEKTGHH